MSFSDSIIVRWQRSKEFCNKIGPERPFDAMPNNVRSQGQTGLSIDKPQSTLVTDAVEKGFLRQGCNVLIAVISTSGA